MPKKQITKKSLQTVRGIATKKKKAITKRVAKSSEGAFPKVGTKAPSFDLLNQEGKRHKLRDALGSWVLIYFYPKDDTPGCTKEACMLRDNFPDFRKLGITVFGVSVDSVKSHAKFAEKYTLPFILLSDEDKKMVTAYGVWGKKKFMGREYMGTNRVSFLIDPKGNIAKIYPKVDPQTHADTVLEDFRKEMM